MYLLRRLSVVALACCTLVLSSCGSPKTFDSVSTISEKHRVQPSTVNAWAAADSAAHTQLAVYAFAVDVAAVHAREPRPHEEQPESTVTSPTPPLAVAAATSSIGEGVPCDGDLVPCWRVEIESKGTWNAYNPSGCGGSGCYGPFQFSGAWAGKLGLPSDLSTATSDQWVNAARELWAGGAGCSNWDAC